MIVTFYSYKGGVGRSMALANVARWFQLRGLRVVMVDWDLEAPGLESFFITDPAAREGARGAVGLVDLLVAYKDLFRSLPRRAANAESRTEDDVSRFSEALDAALPSLSQVLIPIRDISAETEGAGKLWLLPAGCRVGDRFNSYAESVQQFNWAELYSLYEGEAYFEWLRRQLIDPQLADVVLIDSRTGVAEMSGVCTRQLADVVVTLCAPNDQNLQGVEMMAQSFTRKDLIEARHGRPIELIMVGSRLDLAEGRPVDIFKASFDARLGQYVPAAFKRAGVDFGKLRIPYVSAYAYSERLAVGDPEGVQALQEAYEMLAAHIALLAPSRAALREKCRPILQRFFSLPSVYIACPTNPSAATDRLERRLREAGVFAEPIELAEITDAPPPELVGVNASGSVVFALESAVATDRTLTDAFRLLRANGVPTYVVGTGAESLTRLPPGLGGARLIGTDRSFDELLQLLQSANRAVRVPFLAPPPIRALVGRDDELQRIKAALTAGGSRLRRIAIVGMGGIGKTAIARAVCDDKEIADFFDGGILWCALGPQPNLLEAFAKWITALEGPGATVTDVDEAERRLAYHLANRHCLIVLDDLLDWEMLTRIPMGNQCVVLLTTKLRGAVQAPDTLLVEVGPLPTMDAARLLVEELNDQSANSSAAQQLAERLGGSPLAIQLANRSLRVTGSSTGSAEALGLMLRNLDREGIAALGAEAQSVTSAFALVTERLPPHVRSRLHLLAALPPEISVDMAAVRDAGIDDPADMLRGLSSLSLVDFNASAGTVRIPHLTHAYARSLALTRKRAEQNRAADPREGMSRVFISYRREDSAIAGRVYDQLTEYFGPGSTFLDVHTLAPGVDFMAALNEYLDRTHVMLVIIGRSWLERLNSAGDFVSQEIEHALQRGTLVIPVLVDGATIPAQSELPPRLAGLSSRQAFVLSVHSFSQDLDYLIRVIDGARSHPRAERAAPQSDAGRRRLASPSSAQRPAKFPHRLLAVAAVAGLIVVAGATYLLTAGRENAGDTPVGDLPAPLVQAQFDQAEDLYFGRGVPADYARAAQLYDAAANAGYAPAQNALGRLYESGQGISSDEKVALEWYKRAADQGHPDAIAAVRRLSSKPPVPEEPPPSPAKDDYVVVVSAHRSANAAMTDIAAAAKAGYSSGAIYLRDGFYRVVVGPYPTSETAGQAARALGGVLLKRDVYVRKLGEWCASPQPRDGQRAPLIACAN